MSTTWADQWYNSAERSKKLREERRNYDREMKGNFMENTQRALAEILAKGGQQNRVQETANRGSLARQKLVNQGTLGRQRLANIPLMEENRIREPYYRSQAGLLGEQGRVQRLTGDKMEQAMPYELETIARTNEEGKRQFKNRYPEPAQAPQPMYNQSDLEDAIRAVDATYAGKKRADDARKRKAYGSSFFGGTNSLSDIYGP